MTDEMVDTVIIYELTDSGLTPEFYRRSVGINSTTNPLDGFIEDIITSNPTKFMHYYTFSKGGSGGTFGVATLDGLRDS
jgi:hypothetical protein